MSKYTKGPWKSKIEERRIRISGKLIKEHNGRDLKYPRQRIIGEAFGTDEEGLANAKLISAAPELLDMLKQCLPFIEQLANYNTEQSGQTHDAAFCLKANMEQAIAKAEEA